MRNAKRRRRNAGDYLTEEEMELIDEQQWFGYAFQEIQQFNENYPLNNGENEVLYDAKKRVASDLQNIRLWEKFKNTHLQREQEIFTELKSRLSYEALREEVCAVCDNLVLKSTLQYFTVTDSVISILKEQLQIPLGVPINIGAFYDVSHLDVRLAGLLLSEKGFQVSPVAAALAFLATCFSLSAMGDCCFGLTAGFFFPSTARAFTPKNIYIIFIYIYY
jgi:hypothetical protein